MIQLKSIFDPLCHNPWTKGIFWEYVRANQNVEKRKDYKILLIVTIFTNVRQCNS